MGSFQPIVPFRFASVKHLVDELATMPSQTNCLGDQPRRIEKTQWLRVARLSASCDPILSEIESWEAAMMKTALMKADQFARDAKAHPMVLHLSPNCIFRERLYRPRTWVNDDVYDEIDAILYRYQYAARLATAKLLSPHARACWTIENPDERLRISRVTPEERAILRRMHTDRLTPRDYNLPKRLRRAEHVACVEIVDFSRLHEPAYFIDALRLQTTTFKTTFVLANDPRIIRGFPICAKLCEDARDLFDALVPFCACFRWFSDVDQRTVLSSVRSNFAKGQRFVDRVAITCACARDAMHEDSGQFYENLYLANVSLYKFERSIGWREQRAAIRIQRQWRRVLWRRDVLMNPGTKTGKWFLSILFAFYAQSDSSGGMLPPFKPHGRSSGKSSLEDERYHLLKRHRDLAHCDIDRKYDVRPAATMLYV